jgi:hypothetical protein
MNPINPVDIKEKLIDKKMNGLKGMRRFRRENA